MVFDWIKNQLDTGKLEMLFKEDHSGDLDFDSVSSFDGLIDQILIDESLNKTTK